MVARLWVKQIIKGNKYLEEVPAGLKDKVRDILIAEGHEELVSI